MRPGAITLARMFCGPKRVATWRLSARIEAFAIE